jgi:5-methylcytosine-specific restriction endonuclease McrA
MSKKCSSCKLERPIDCFARSKGRPDGRHPSCKQCRAAYYKANRDWITRQYYEYRKANAERFRAIAKKYAQRRFFYIRANNVLIRIKGDRSRLGELCKEIARLWKRQRGVCPITGRRLNRENAQLDHITPLKLGGSSGIENLRWVHRDVNYAKRDLLDEQFFQLCSDVVKYRNRS